MECLSEERDGVAIVSPRGDVDMSTVEGFRSSLDGLLGAGLQYFVIDLSGVGMMDSTGLAALVHLYKRVRIGEGDVTLAAVPSQVMEVLDLTRLSQVFDIYPTADDAALAIKSHD